MKCRTGSNDPRTDVPEDIQLLAEEIADEPIPENLLALARQLQRALGARLKHRKEANGEDAGGR